MTQINLPAELNEIGNGSFWGTGIIKVIIPRAVNAFGYDCFTGIKEIVFEEGSSVPNGSITYIEKGNTIYRIELAASMIFGERTDNLIELQNDEIKNYKIICKTGDQIQYCKRMGYSYELVESDVKEELQAENMTVGSAMEDVSYEYAADAIRPSLYYKGAKLEEGTDYTAVYSDNVEPGTASIEVTGKGAYTGEATKQFKITKRSISNCQIRRFMNGKELVDKDGNPAFWGDYEFDGTEHKGTIELYNGEHKLTEGTDYFLTYSGNLYSGENRIYLNASSKYYTGEYQDYYVVKAPILDECEIEINENMTFGDVINSPVKSVKIGSFEFKENESFWVEYKDAHTSGGIHHAVIVGRSDDCQYPALLGRYEFAYEVKPVEKVNDENLKLYSEWDYYGKDVFFYTGSEVKPIIYYKETAMTEGVDYTAVYKDNVEPGEATIIITGKNSFKGTYELHYFIKPCHIYDPNITITAKVDGKNVDTDGSVKIPFDGKEHKPEVVVTRLLDGKKITLEEGKDYEITELDNYNLTSGTVSFNVSGLNHYDGLIGFDYTITPPSLEACTVTLDKNSFVYASGQEQKPQISVSCNGVVFTEGGSYDVTWIYEDLQGKKTENIYSFQNAGTYYGTITGRKNDKWVYNSAPSLSGTKTVTYQIQLLDISNAEIILPDQEFIYRGEAVAPIPTVKVNGEDVVQNCWDYSSWNSIANYEVTYTGNTAAGTATMTIKGSGNCTGSVSKTFKILPSLQTCQISLSKDSYDYNNGIACVPEVTVRDGNKILREDKDYKLTYSNNVNAGYAMVTITPAGDYRDEITKEYIIQPNSIENAVVTLGETIYSYDGSAKKPQVVSVVLNGKTLVAGTDYEIGYTNNINEGTAYVIITGVGNYTATLSQSFRILPYNAGMDSVYEKGDTLISGDYIYTIMDDEEKEVELSGSSNKKLTNVVVPKTVQDENGVVYTVTSVGQKAFYKNNKIKSVVIGNEVRSIEDYAFYGCKNVSSIKIGKKLEIVGASAFRKCTKLTGITLPKSLDEIGKNAFYGCKKLKTITINANTVVDISDNAMKGISKKAVIKVPSKLVKKYKKNLKSKTGFTKTMTVKKK